MAVLIGLLVLLVVGLVTWGVFSIIGDMAADRGLSPQPWWFIALCWSPFLAMFVRSLVVFRYIG